MSAIRPACLLTAAAAPEGGQLGVEPQPPRRPLTPLLHRSATVGQLGLAGRRRRPLTGRRGSRSQAATAGRSMAATWVALQGHAPGGQTGPRS
jgi:hypothetical protein